MWCDLSFLLQNDHVGEQRDFRIPHLRAPGAVQCVLSAQVGQHDHAQEKRGKVVVVLLVVGVSARKKTELICYLSKAICAKNRRRDFRSSMAHPYGLKERFFFFRFSPVEKCQQESKILIVPKRAISSIGIPKGLIDT